MKTLRSGEHVKKRRQHHVWQRYLKSWTSAEGVIFVLQDGEIRPTGTPVVAVEKDFYKMPKLTTADIALVRFCVIGEAVNPIARESHERFLQLLIQPDRIVANSRFARGHFDEIDNMLDMHRTNILENHHAIFERAFGPLLDRALSGDIEFYKNDETCCNFLYFVSMQYLRTSGIKTRVVETVSAIDLSRIWNVITPMLAMNTATSLYLERRDRKLVLIRNNTDVPFITGDQPVVNLYRGQDNPPTRFSLYYPLSPRLALILPEVGEEAPVSTKSLTAAQVSDLNAMILAASHRQVFAESEAALLRSLQRNDRRV